MITDEIKEQFADIILAKDVKKFRTLIFTHRALLSEEMVTKILKMSREETLHVMTYWAATQAVFAPFWAENRNLLRTQDLEKDFTLATEDLKTYIKDKAGEYPHCQECRWLRNAPPNEKNPCAHLGALPTDVCCAGWTKGAEDDVSSPGKRSGEETRDSISHGGSCGGQPT